MASTSFGSDEPVAYSATYEGETVTVKAARDDLDRWLGGCNVDAGLRERVALLVSELASNAVQASPAERYEIHVNGTQTRLSISVANLAPDAVVPPRDEWGPEDILSPRGRGLAIVDALADHVHVHVHLHGTDRRKICVTAILG